MYPQRSEAGPDPKELAIIGLTLWVLLGAMIAIYQHQQRELRDELRIERGRRDELEAQGRQREEKLDGALDMIKKLTDERDQPE